MALFMQLFFYFDFCVGMWASREMLKDNKDAQLYVKTTLRELFLYCIFLFVICYGKTKIHNAIQPREVCIYLIFSVFVSLIRPVLQHQLSVHSSDSQSL